MQRRLADVPPDERGVPWEPLVLLGDQFNV